MKRSQKTRVEDALRKAGQVGITRLDFLAPQVIDRGEPIINIPARIEELRKEGLSINSSATRHGCAVYVLVASDASGVGGPVGLVQAPGASEATDRLFDPVAVSRPAGAYDELDAA